MGQTEQIIPLKERRARLRPSARAGGPVDPEAVPFQPDPAMIEERALPWFARSVVYVVLLLVAAAATWASLSQVDRVVIARGKLITVDPLMTVQPLETGVVHSITVGVGDTVKAGEVLATLDPTFPQSEQTADEERLASMTAEAWRLEAEIYGKPFEPAWVGDPVEAKYLKLQMAVYTHRQAEYRAAVAAAEADAAKLEAGLVTNRNSQTGLEERVKVVSQVEGMRDELFKLSAGSRLNLLQSRLDRLSLSDQLGEKKNQEKELEAQLASAREQKAKYINNWVREAGERLTDLQQQIATERQKLTAAERRRSLVVLRAPADGVVLELGQRAIGSVAKEAEPLITLVPSGNKIEAEVDVESADVARLRVGDTVRVKLDALPFQRHGTITGRVRVITENSFQPDKASTPQPGKDADARPAFFRARIALGPLTLQNVPKDFRLIPGMTTSAEIIVGKRTIISYLLDPVIRVFDESMREP
ncbi:MAG TPA: HlyD family type I secretion periplasmic adaptor subunit [Xanthobacteraceae bacterium]|jgi:HlyD family secretion protein|nr:HlyD family type I secretion periplasmic adaptor subunit [Xanthobacteraceae bacterium]